jgi:ABC-2 type transport system ATP-binding protein
MTCDQVIIIHRGRVAASGPLSELSRQAGEETVILMEAEAISDLEPVQSAAGVRQVESEPVEGRTRLRITTARPDELTQHLCALSVRHGWRLHELRPQRQTLEELFVRITSGEE